MSRLRIKEIIGTGIIKFSGWITTLIILLITIYLFKEGMGLFFSRPTMERFDVAVHKEIPVQELTADVLKKIKRKEVKTWKELGVNSEEKITLIYPVNLKKFATEEQLGKDLENLPQVLDSLAKVHKGILLVFPKDLIPADLKEIRVPPYSVGEVLLGDEWYPTSKPVPSFGIFPLIIGTLWVTAGAIALAFPLGLAVAIGLAELFSPKLRKYIKVFVELFAAIPSVVFGFFGLIIVVPILKDVFNVPVGESALAGSLILALMSLPTIVSIAEDALSNVPRSLKEASLALGATHWETIWNVSIPYAVSGIASATILGIGRAFGETMAVLMVTGNAAVIPSSFLDPVRTLSATIAAELGEAPQGGTHYQALFVISIVLFLITTLFNTLANVITQKKKRTR